MSERVFYPDTNDVSSTSKVVSLSIACDRTREMILPIHAFLSRHSFSTRRSLVRRLVSVGGSLIRTADQARRKVRGVRSTKMLLKRNAPRPHGEKIGNASDFELSQKPFGRKNSGRCQFLSQQRTLNNHPSHVRDL